MCYDDAQKQNLDVWGRGLGSSLENVNQDADNTGREVRISCLTTINSKIQCALYGILCANQIAHLANKASKILRSKQ